MSDEKRIEVSEEILKEIFNAANLTPPKNITDESLLEAVFKIRQPEVDMGSMEGFNPSSNNILVIDDIGVVTYQLKFY